MSTLEHRYRRLLRWYPADHRHLHEDEMLGVLMAGARPRQERPHLGESVDLIAGAVRIRLHRFARGLTGGWGKTLGLASVLAPVLVAAAGLGEITFWLASGGDLTSWPMLQALALVGTPVVAAATAVLAWRGRRPAAAALAWLQVVPVVALAGQTGTEMLGDLELHAQVSGAVAYALTQHLPVIVTALVLSIPYRSRRQGTTMSRRWLWSFAVTFGLACGFGHLITEGSVRATLGLLSLTVLATWAGLAMGTPAYRRVALILALPALTAVVQFVSIDVIAVPGELIDTGLTYDTDLAGTRNIAVAAVVYAVVGAAALRRGAGNADRSRQHPADRATA